MLPAARLLLVALLLAATTASAQVVLNYEVYKRHNYNQTTDAGAVEAGSVKYDVIGYVNVADGQTIAAPAFTVPSGSSAGSKSLLQLGTTNDWIRNLSATSKAGFDAQFGNGSYDFSVNGANVAFDLSVENYAPAASITGATWASNRLQLDNSGAYTLNFSGPTAGNFTDGTDLIRLTLRQQSVGTTFVYETSTLQNSFLISAGTLVDGARYDLELLVIDVTQRDTTSISGAIGLGGFGSRTFAQVDVTVSAIPEPSTYALCAGALGLLVAAWRRRRAAA